ncbi:hypothetical protein M2272_002809 [Mycobacterium frederiksbergense]|uniref:DUF1214 domain-containing protein n=1 Tax=Mycolicibacterium frederiksbergense TaxID=117567 RepID=A0ABT6KZP3_9MYCO|nr:hypothetical protein [Mycolicibacterium frederiksbergense]MDH6196166.1 hypothetical protein [Mycolicibacterium frederiksbergense]
MESSHSPQAVDDERAPLARAAWSLVEQMQRNAVQVVAEDAETEREYLEGLRAVARISSLCAQISVEADPDQPRFFDMCSPTRMVGGPNPDGNYYLAMIRGDRAYRVSGSRGTTTYLGFQVLAGTGLTPRRMAAYVSDTELALRRDQFTLVLAADEPSPEVLGDGQWVPIPRDASSIVVREYIADRATERTSSLQIEVLDAAQVSPLSDAELGEQLTAMAWTLLKLITLHRTIKPEMLTTANVLLTSEAADLGAADTTPDNLYMIGTYRLEPDQALVLEFEPPDTRYWNVALETIWHEVPEPGRRNVSVTNRGVAADDAGVVRIAISARDFGYGHWLDTGGRHRGFVVLRWLDNPTAPDVRVSVRTEGTPK